VKLDIPAEIIDQIVEVREARRALLGEVIFVDNAPSLGPPVTPRHTGVRVA